MAQLEKVQKAIREISRQTKNTTFSEIRWVVDRLDELGYEVGRKRNGQHYMFYVNGQRFGVVTHNPGEKQVKPCYVKDFLKAMIELELLQE